MKASIVRVQAVRPPVRFELDLSEDEMWLIHAALYKVSEGSESYRSDTARLQQGLKLILDSGERGEYGSISVQL